MPGRAALTTIAMAFDPREADIKRPVATPAMSPGLRDNSSPPLLAMQVVNLALRNFAPSAWFGPTIHTHNREPYLFHSMGDALSQPPVVTNGSPIGKRRKLAWHRCPMRRGREMSSCPMAGNSIIAVRTSRAMNSGCSSGLLPRPQTDPNRENHGGP